MTTKHNPSATRSAQTAAQADAVKPAEVAQADREQAAKLQTTADALQAVKVTVEQRLTNVLTFAHQQGEGQRRAGINAAMLLAAVANLGTAERNAVRNLKQGNKEDKRDHMATVLCASGLCSMQPNRNKLTVAKPVKGRTDKQVNALKAALTRAWPIVAYCISVEKHGLLSVAGKGTTEFLMVPATCVYSDAAIADEATKVWTSMPLVPVDGMTHVKGSPATDKAVTTQCKDRLGIIGVTRATDKTPGAAIKAMVTDVEGVKKSMHVKLLLKMTDSGAGDLLDGADFEALQSLRDICIATLVQYEAASKSSWRTKFIKENAA